MIFKGGLEMRQVEIIITQNKTSIYALSLLFATKLARDKAQKTTKDYRRHSRSRGTASSTEHQRKILKFDI
jgi:hypothetical protein